MSRERSEKLIKADIREWLNKQHDIQVHFNYNPYMSTAGVSDRLGYLTLITSQYAIPFAIEVKKRGKTPGGDGKLTPNQIRFKEKCIAAKVPILSPCNDVEQVKIFINKLRNNEETNGKE